MQLNKLNFESLIDKCERVLQSLEKFIHQTTQKIIKEKEILD